MIEKWKHTAFGSDFGLTFLEFIENNFADELSVKEIYKKTDIEKYLTNPEILEEENDHNVSLKNAENESYVHFEDVIIALSVLMVESKINGAIDLTKSFGNKTITLWAEQSEIETIFLSLTDIYNKPHNYVLFEMMLEEEAKETRDNIKEILIELKKFI